MLVFASIYYQAEFFGDRQDAIAARTATDLEAICNTLLLIFGSGMVFGDVRLGRGA